MTTPRTLLGLVVVAGCLIVCGIDAFAVAPPSRKEKDRTISGVVVEVDHKRDKRGQGIIKVRGGDHGPGKGEKGKGEKGAWGNKGDHIGMIRVTAATRFEFLDVSGGKGNKPANGKGGQGNTEGKGKGQGKNGVIKETLAHFRDVHPGMRVRITLDHGHHAELVAIMKDEDNRGGKGQGKGKPGKK